MPFLKRAFFGLALTATVPATALAQDYPNKPIRVIVSIAAGSVTDVIIRAAANDISPRLGQQLVIENKGGAAGILGGKRARRRLRMVTIYASSIIRQCRTTHSCSTPFLTIPTKT